MDNDGETLEANRAIAQFRETGDVWQAADAMAALIGKPTALGRAGRRRAQRAVEDKQKELLRILAEEFGRRNGLALTQKGRVPKRFTEHWDGAYSHYRFDHPYMYWDRSTKRHFVAAHLYRSIDGPEIYEPNHKVRLRGEVITDFPSWWYPGRTTLVLWREV